MRACAKSKFWPFAQINLQHQRTNQGLITHSSLNSTARVETDGQAFGAGTADRRLLRLLRGVQSPPPRKDSCTGNGLGGHRISGCQDVLLPALLSTHPHIHQHKRPRSQRQEPHSWQSQKQDRELKNSSDLTTPARNFFLELNLQLSVLAAVVEAPRPLCLTQQRHTRRYPTAHGPEHNFFFGGTRSCKERMSGRESPDDKARRARSESLSRSYDSEAQALNEMADKVSCSLQLALGCM